MSGTISPLTLQMLMASSGAPQDPAIAASLPRLQMAQSMMQSGMSDAPTSRLGAVSRLGQAILGNLMYGNANEGLQDILKQRAQETKTGLEALNLGGASGTPGLLPAPTPIAQPPSVTPPNTNAFEPMMAASEGGASPSAVNASGHSGQYQFSTGRLADLGVYTPAPGENLKGNEWKGSFNIPGFQEVRTQGDFLANPEAQKAVFGSHVSDIDRAISGTPGADSMSRDGLRAVAHLGGVQGMKDFVSSGGTANPHDANGTRLSDYYQKFAGPGAAQPVSAPGQAPAYQSSPATQHALDMINRADQIARMFPNNPQLQDAAKRTTERAKVMLEQGRHLETEATSMQRAHDAEVAADRRQRESLGQADRHFNAGSLPAGYQRTPEGGAAPIPGVPIKSGEAGPFAGNAMDAQSNNVLLSIGPKIKDGTATEQEHGQYSLAYEHLSQGRIMPVPDPTDPTGQRQVLARIPGAVPAQFPNPTGQPTGAAGSPSAGPEPIPGTTKAAPPTSEDEKKAAGFAVRMRETGKALNELETKGIHSGNLGGSLLESGGVAGRALQSPEFQVYQQQMQDWVRAKLRRESGAVIGKEEMADEIRTYFPQPGDTSAKIEAKRHSRELAQLGMEAGGGRARIESPAAPATSAIPAPPPGFKVIQ